MKLLNPFAFYLERKEKRFYEVNTKPVYKNGEYTTFRFDGKWFVTCRNNIIVTETTGIPQKLIDALVAGERPSDYSKHHYDRMLREYDNGLKYAKMVGFEVTKISD
jgi:hypothetical protein